MAQNKTLMKRKVPLKRVERSVCPISGKTPNVKLDEVTAMLPLRCVNSVNEMEKKLKAEDFAQATVRKSNLYLILCEFT